MLVLTGKIICLHRNLHLGAHLRREVDTQSKASAGQAALEHNRLDVRFKDYLIQLVSCQSDKGEALNQVTIRRENILCLSVEQWPSCLQHLVESVHRHHNSLPDPRHGSFIIQPIRPPLQWPALTPSCHQLSPSQKTRRGFIIADKLLK